MKLQLERPLIGVDVETTWDDAGKNYVVEIGLLRVDVSSTIKEWRSYVKPPLPIRKEATDKHRIDDQTVAQAPTFADLAKKLHATLTREPVDLFGYNVRFDRRVLEEEFARVNMELTLPTDCRMLDPQKIYFLKFPRDLSAAVEEFLGRRHEGAHGALSDIRAAWEVLQAQLERFRDLPRNVPQLGDLCYPGDPRWVDPEGKLVWNEHGEACIGFGKWKGVPLSRVSKDYLSWMNGADFSPAVKRLVRDALAGVFPRKGA